MNYLVALSTKIVDLLASALQIAGALIVIREWSRVCNESIRIRRLMCVGSLELDPGLLEHAEVPDRDFLDTLEVEPSGRNPADRLELLGRCRQIEVRRFGCLGHGVAAGAAPYSRPGGASPYCYPADVPASAVAAYRQRSPAR
jgi:hypothetical protein